MLVVVEQTREEKIAMYMKCTKRELIEMVIGCNSALSAMIKAQEPIWHNVKLGSIEMGNHGRKQIKDGS